MKMDEERSTLCVKVPTYIYICPHISIYICMTTCQKQTLLCTAIVTVPCMLEPAQASTEGACVELQKAGTINLACTHILNVYMQARNLFSGIRLPTCTREFCSMAHTYCKSKTLVMMGQQWHVAPLVILATQLPQLSGRSSPGPGGVDPTVAM